MSRLDEKHVQPQRISPKLIDGAFGALLLSLPILNVFFYDAFAKNPFVADLVVALRSVGFGCFANPYFAVMSVQFVATLFVATIVRLHLRDFYVSLGLGSVIKKVEPLQSMRWQIVLTIFLSVFILFSSLAWGSFCADRTYAHFFVYPMDFGFLLSAGLICANISTMQMISTYRNKSRKDV
jgi:hypothetical protein